MAENLHRWKKWIENRQAAEILGGIADGLRGAWGLDMCDPGAYPMNTAYFFGEVRMSLRGERRPEIVEMPPPQEPHSFSD